MKTAKLIGTTALMCLFVVACAKSNKEEQARLAKGGGSSPTPDSSPISERTTRETLKIDLTKSDYQGEQILLSQEKDGKTQGRITITGEDAKVAFERLRVKENSETVAGQSAVTKTGKNYTCRSFQNGNDCYIHLDYRTGNVLVTNEVAIDEQSKEITEQYTGKTLSLVGDKNNTGLLTINGTDAQALFESLTAAAKDLSIQDAWMKSSEKVGGNIKCSVQASTKDGAQSTYTCFVHLNTTDGTVKAAESSDIGKGEKQSDEATDEKKEEGTPEPELEKHVEGTAT